MSDQVEQHEPWKRDRYCYIPRTMPMDIWLPESPQHQACWGDLVQDTSGSWVVATLPQTGVCRLPYPCRILNCNKYRFRDSSERIYLGDIIVHDGLARRMERVCTDQYIGESVDSRFVICEATRCVPLNYDMYAPGYRYVEFGEYLVIGDIRVDGFQRKRHAGLHSEGVIAGNGTHIRPIQTMPAFTLETRPLAPLGYRWTTRYPNDNLDAVLLNAYRDRYSIVEVTEENMLLVSRWNNDWQLTLDQHQDIRGLTGVTFSLPNIRYLGPHHGPLVRNTFDSLAAGYLVVTRHGASIVTGICNKEYLETRIGQFYPHYFMIGQRKSLVFWSSNMPSGEPMEWLLLERLERMAAASHTYLGMTIRPEPPASLTQRSLTRGRKVRL